MKKTLITHFYNEEYLLPWFLNHHKKIFDHGIMVNYNSTDKSVEIIKQICPNWEIINSRNNYFDSYEIDKEIIDIESQINGWKVCLNVTEHLIGDYSILNDDLEKQILLPSMIFVDNDVENYPTHDLPIYEQKNVGFLGLKERQLRSIHNFNFDYLKHCGPGRHIDNSFLTFLPKLIIFYYGWCPFNDISLHRKLQIQHRIPEHDKIRGLGGHHIKNKSEFEEEFKTKFLIKSRNISKEIESFILNHKNLTKI